MKRLLFFLLLLSFPVLAQSGETLVDQAKAAEQSGDATRALQLWGRAADAFEQEENPSGKGLSLFYKAVLQYKTEDLDGALASLNEAGLIFTELGRQDGVALVALQAGNVMLEKGDLTGAEERFGESLQAARRHGDPARVGDALKALAGTLDAQHRWSEAYDAYRQLMDHQIVQDQRLAAADTLTTLGAIKQMQSDPETAEAHYRHALEMFTEEGNVEQTAELLDRLSRLLLGQMEFARARQNLNRALEFHIAHGLREREAIARANLGYALESQNDFNEAIKQYRNSAKLFYELKDEAQTTQVTRQLIKAMALGGDDESAYRELRTLFTDDPLAAGELCLELGWNERAEEYFQKSLESAADTKEKARLLNRLGMLATERTELIRARELYSESLKLARDSSDFSLAASVLNNLGENYQSSGNYDAAEPCYSEALDFFRASGSAKGEAFALSNLGTLMFARGNYNKAIRYLQQAQSLALDPKTFGGPHSLQGTILNALGLVHQFLGRTDESERLYSEAIAVRRSLNDFKGEIVTLNNLAAMYSEAHNSKDAERTYNLALKLSERRKDPSHLAPLYNNLGQVQNRLDRSTEARESYQKALELYRAQGIKDGEAITLSNLAAIEKDRKQGLKLYSQAVTILEKVGNRQSLANTLSALGQAQAEAGERKAAIDSLTRSVDILDDLALGLAPNDKSYFLGKNQEAYRALVDLLLEEGEVEEAFHINERARSRALLDLLGGRNLPIRNAPPELAIREQTLKSRIRELLSAPATPENKETLSAMKTEYKTVLAEIARHDPGGAELRSNEVVELDELFELLGPDRALLQYLMVDDGVFLLLVADGQVWHYRYLQSGFDLKERIFAWREDLLLEENPGLGLELGELLIGAAAEKLSGVKELVIVPHQTLHYLPFSALPYQGETLVDRFHLTTAPSASAWALCQKKVNSPNRISVAALGNLGVDLADTPATDLARSNQFQPLPGTLKEMQALSRLFPQAHTLVEEDLTTLNLRNAAGNSGVLHVATHGVLDSNQPIFSGLVASDGLVTVAEILEWESTPRLVVLSACETALGELRDGDDLVGLSRAFQAGGTRCLIATLWPVSDHSTALWMGHFYEALKADQTVSEATASASRELRKEYPQPYFWAPFVVIGDGDVKVKLD